MNFTLKLLMRAAYEERMAHLLLFHGGSATERKQAGLLLAQTLNCSNPGPEGPCLQCSSCRRIESGNYPDVLCLQPQKSSFGIEEIIRWQEKVYRKHFEGKYKVFILEQADTLTLPAENALLKVIEEPPERTVIILSAQNAETLLPTIQSRAQSVYFPVTRVNEWVGSQEYTVSSDEAREAFRISGEDPECAQGILELGLAKVKEWVRNFQEAVEARDFIKVFTLFPVEKDEALIYLQVLAYREREKSVQPGAILAIYKALDRIRMQANPRLAIEVLALELFRQGGNESGRGRGGSF